MIHLQKERKREREWGERECAGERGREKEKKAIGMGGKRGDR